MLAYRRLPSAQALHGTQALHILLGFPPAETDSRFAAPHVTRLDPRRIARRPALLPFRRILRSSRTVGIGVARGARAGKDVSARADSGRCLFPPFSARELRRNHFAVAIGLAPSGRISGDLRRYRCHAASRSCPPMARSPRIGPAVFPTASPPGPTRRKRITSLRAFSPARL